MFSSIRWPVSLALLGSTLLALLLAGFYLFAQVRAEFLRSSEANLRANAESIASLMGSHMDQVALTEMERRLITNEMKRLSGQLGVRLCVVNWRGDVLEDSTPDGRRNFKGLPEIEEALNGRYQMQVRDHAMVLAVPIRAGGRVMGAVYGTRPLGEVERSLTALRYQLLLAGGIAMAVSTALSLGLAWFLIRPVRKLADGVRTISEGDYAFRLGWRRRDELGQLGRDVDEMAARLERHRAVLMQFVSDASHELKTPIASMKALSEALLDGGLQDPVAGPRFAGLLQSEVQRMERLVGDMLVLQRGDSGASVVLGQVHLAELVDELLGRLDERGERGFFNEVEETLEVSADRGRLEQVLSNLLENALAATREVASRRVEVRAQVQEETVRVEVLDNGPGLPASEHERVFERFYRVDSGRTRQSGGSGLGLAICRQIVEAHGGRLWVESEPGDGARFVFTLKP